MSGLCISQRHLSDVFARRHESLKPKAKMLKTQHTHTLKKLACVVGASAVLAGLPVIGHA